MSIAINKQEGRRHQLISEISLMQFGVAPKSIIRMQGGICNEVYQITIDGRDLIVRMNAEERFLPEGVYYGLHFMRALQLLWLRSLDTCAPGIAFALAVGRLGCFAAGCCLSESDHRVRR